MITTYDFVPVGPAVHERPGKTFPLYCVFSKGMSPPGANAGVVTASFAPLAAGKVRSASCDAPTSVGAGGCCADDPAAKPLMAKAIATQDTFVVMIHHLR